MRVGRSVGCWALLLGGLFWGQPARAQLARPRLTAGAQLVEKPAWTDDGAYFVYQSSYGLENKPDGVAFVSRVIVDSRSGLQQSYEVGLSDRQYLAAASADDRRDVLERIEELRKRRNPVGTEPDFLHWQAAHRLKPCQPRRSSPDGSVSAQLALKASTRLAPSPGCCSELRLVESKLTSRWVGEELRFVSSDWRSAEGNPNVSAFLEGYDGQAWAAAMSVTLSRKGGPGRSYALELLDEMGPLKGEVSLCWSPDSRRAAVLAHQLPHNARIYDAVGEMTWATLLPVAGPRVHLLAGRRGLAAVAAKVALALEQAGQLGVITPVAYEESRFVSGSRPPLFTLVYSTAAARPAAQAVAAALQVKPPLLPMAESSVYDLAIEVGQP